MTIPIVMALTIHYESRVRWWLLAPAAVSIGLHITALWYAGGRGPWVAAITGLIVFVAASFLRLGRERALKSAGLVMAGGFTAVVITSLRGVENRTGRDLSNPGGIFSDISDGVQYIFKGRSEPPVFVLPVANPTPVPAATPMPDVAPVPTEQPASGETARQPLSAELGQQPIPESSPETQTDPPPPTQPLETVGRPTPRTILEASQIKSFGIVDPSGQAIGNRADIWRGALELALNRETVADESTVLRGLRVMFGFGPDMYFYSYPNTIRPLGGFAANSHTHNYGLQVLMEQVTCPLRRYQ